MNVNMKTETECTSYCVFILRFYENPLLKEDEYIVHIHDTRLNCPIVVSSLALSAVSGENLFC